MKHGKYHETRPLVSMKDLIDSGAKIFGEKPAFLTKNEKGGIYKEVSFQQLKDDIDGLGTYLLHLGLQNAKIAVIGPNCYQWVVAYFAIVNGTGTVVPLDKELSPIEIKNLIHAGGCKAVFSTPDYVNILKEAGVEHVFNMDPYEKEKSQEVGHIQHMICEGAQMLANGDRSFVDAVVDVKKPLQSYLLPVQLTYPKG